MRSNRRAAAVAALSLIAAMAAAGAPPAAAQSCDAPAQSCGALLDQTCLSKLGAGVLAVEDAEAEGAARPQGADCRTQTESYRSCLTEIVERCPGGETPERVEAASSLLEALAALGGLIADPKTGVEFYNNALVYERRGDALSARRMYEKAIAAGVRAIDLHARYSALLRAQEGVLGAREIYADLARGAPEDGPLQMANALLAPAARREAALRALVEPPEPFAPAHYEISRLFSRDRLGDQSLADQRAEKSALEAFAAADAEGRIYRWFLRKDAAETWRADAERRLAAYANRRIAETPVTLSAMASNDGWIVTFNLAEAAREIRYSVDGGPARATGSFGTIDPRTGLPAPKTFVSLPLRTKQAAISVWYDDVRGVERGPFALSFDRDVAFVRSAKQVLEGVTQGWIAGRAFDEGRFLVYFTHLLSYRCALSKIEYGVGSETPDQTFAFAPCDPENPYAVDTDAPIFLDLPTPPAFVTVRLTYADGALSPIRRFEF